uniref:RNase_Zc3h12a domain-containing protein n=1 Tax=Steinernema glaseri TaxID=37863 RepID=A0A1I7Y0Z4_9BILA
MESPAVKSTVPPALATRSSPSPQPPPPRVRKKRSQGVLPRTACLVTHEKTPIRLNPSKGRTEKLVSTAGSAGTKSSSVQPVKKSEEVAVQQKVEEGEKTQQKSTKKKKKNRGKKTPRVEKNNPKEGVNSSVGARGRVCKWPLVERHFTSSVEEAIPRLFVIDGCNVARSASGRSREFVDCLGLLCVVRYLVLRNIDVVIFLPVVYNNQYNFNAKNLHVLPVLNKLSILTFTPARASRGGRDAFINYDDLYVLDFAERYGGCVVSSDRFDDIRKIKEYGKYHNIIDSRRIDVRFKLGEGSEKDRIRGHLPEFFIHGDQLGKEAKEVKAAEEYLEKSMFCHPNDPEFLNVSTRRKMWSAERKEKILTTIDRLMI